MEEYVFNIDDLSEEEREFIELVRASGYSKEEIIAMAESVMAKEQEGETICI